MYETQEQKHHAGKFIRLLNELDPDEEAFYAEGAKEVWEAIGKMKRGRK